MSRFVAPILLVLVASLQIVLAESADLSPWLGGGFGMFATIDSRDERHLLVIVESPGLTRHPQIPEDLRDWESRVRAFPTASRMQAFAEALLARERERIPGVEGVRLELWRNQRTRGSLALSESLVRSARAEARIGD